jgi:hypothetical protein
MRVLSPALQEITQAALWFDAQRVGLGDEFWQSVDAKLLQIGQNPLRFAKSEFATPHVDLRCVVMRRFNYVIHFLVEVDEVQVVAVAHGARRPGYWLRRVKK